MNTRYLKARLQTQREFTFWAAILQTPAHLRTRAQRKHVQTRQSRGRIVALENLIRGGMRPADTFPADLKPPTREQRRRMAGLDGPQDEVDYDKSDLTAAEYQDRTS